MPAGTYARYMHIEDLKQIAYHISFPTQNILHFATIHFHPAHDLSNFFLGTD